MRQQTDWGTINQEEQALDMYLDLEDPTAVNYINRAISHRWCRERRKRHQAEGVQETPAAPSAESCRGLITGLVFNIQAPGRLQLLLRLVERMYLTEHSEREGKA